MRVCVCMCVCMCVRMCVRACVCVCVCEREREREREKEREHLHVRIHAYVCVSIRVHVAMYIWYKPTTASHHHGFHMCICMVTGKRLLCVTHYVAACAMSIYIQHGYVCLHVAINSTYKVKM